MQLLPSITQLRLLNAATLDLNPYFLSDPYSDEIESLKVNTSYEYD